MNAVVFLLLAISVGVFSAPTGVPTTLETILFTTNSKEGDLDVAQSIECIQHFLSEISEGTYHLELPHLNHVTDGDTVTETHQILVKAGTSRLNGCTMLWTLSGSKQDLPFLVLKKRETNEKGILDGLLRGGEDGRHQDAGDEAEAGESRHSPVESSARGLLGGLLGGGDSRHHHQEDDAAEEESRHSPDESSERGLLGNLLGRKRRMAPENRQPHEGNEETDVKDGEENRHSPDKSSARGLLDGLSGGGDSRHHHQEDEAETEESRHSPDESSERGLLGNLLGRKRRMAPENRHEQEHDDNGEGRHSPDESSEKGLLDGLLRRRKRMTPEKRKHQSGESQQPAEESERGLLDGLLRRRARRMAPVSRHPPEERHEDAGEGRKHTEEEEGGD